MSNVSERMARRQLNNPATQGQIRNPVAPLNREEARLRAANARKSWARKQKVEGVLAVILGTLFIAVSAVFVLAVALIPFAILGLGIWAFAFGVVDIVTVGWNVWAVVWVIVGLLLISRFKVIITNKN